MSNFLFRYYILPCHPSHQRVCGLRKLNNFSKKKYCFIKIGIYFFNDINSIHPISQNTSRMKTKRQYLLLKLVFLYKNSVLIWGDTLGVRINTICVPTVLAERPLIIFYISRPSLGVGSKLAGKFNLLTSGFVLFLRKLSHVRYALKGIV